MSNILSQISGVILAGTNLEDQQMFDGIRNLANMSIISYPKARLLQIILDPRIISKDIHMSNKCAQFKFGAIREQLVEDLSKILKQKEMIMMLKSFTNQLLDNDEVMNVKVDESVELQKNANVKLLYKKCQELGLQYGLLNLFPAKVLMKMARSKYKIVDQIIKRVNDQDEFKDILHLLAIDYSRGVEVVRIVSHISVVEESIFRYVMSLPNVIIEILLDYIGMTARKLKKERIEALFELYNKKQDLFLSVKKKPLLAKLFMLHDNFEVMNDFLDMLACNNRKIGEIHSFNTSISAFLFSHINGKSQVEDAQALMNLGMTDMRRCKLIISNGPIIAGLGLEICFLCNFSIDFPEIFDLIFDKKNENLDIIYHIKKKKKISAEAVIKEIVALGALDKVREFFSKIHDEYD